MKNKDFDKNSHDIDLFGLMSITTGYEDQDWNQEYLIGKEIDALIEMGLIKIEKGFIIWQYPNIKSQIFEELIKLSKDKRLRWDGRWLEIYDPNKEYYPMQHNEEF